MKVPLAGIVLGYLFVLRRFSSSGERAGPGYWRGGDLTIGAAGCEGDWYLAGFSSMSGLALELLEA